ncbi:MAG TPA: hypothetical protein DG754_07865 [Bacteroidales bacterium]|jgi:hypothetical protein|nr:hypothetical protein [Bacteroidales bacterium]
MNTEKVEIPLSKKKVLLLLFGAIVFVVLGLLLLLLPDRFTHPVLSSTLIIRVIGVIAVLFFGATGIFQLKKLLDKTPGLIIDENGITDNTNAISVGLINWADITGIKTKQVLTTKSLLIFTSNPDKYLDRVNGFKRKLMKGNIKMCGTPLTIISNTLKCNFEDLERLIRDKLIEQKE